MPLVLLAALFWQASDFRSTQLGFSRVRQARTDKEAALKAAFAEQGLSYPPKGLFLRAFKRDKRLEVWVKHGDSHKLFRTYPICASSGQLGPKSQEGDGQVPEGFYEISDFNPSSNYHLSLKVSYPNAADRARSKAARLGGEIFVHGNCVTIGCIPLTDALIEEVYLLAVEAKAGGQAHLPIHIFPTALDDAGMRWLEQSTTDPELIAFWRSLKPGYEAFENAHR